MACAEQMGKQLLSSMGSGRDNLLVGSFNLDDSDHIRPLPRAFGTGRREAQMCDMCMHVYAGPFTKRSAAGFPGSLASHHTVVRSRRTAGADMCSIRSLIASIYVDDLGFFISVEGSGYN